MSKVRLARVLKAIVRNDRNYRVRYELVFQALGLAVACGYEVGLRDDPDAKGWPVVYIELPSGQVSWHMPEHRKHWDGHTTEEKFRRIEAFHAATRPEERVCVRCGYTFTLEPLVLCKCGACAEGEM